jgi:hypothetical protein
LQFYCKILSPRPLSCCGLRDDVAKELGMSLRNMQKKLKDKGSHYKEILEDTRKHLA